MEDLPANAPLWLQIRRTFSFALPIVVARSAILVMFTVDTMMTGWSGARLPISASAWRRSSP